MKDALYIIRPNKISDTLQKMLAAACSGRSFTAITSPESLPDLRNARLLFAVDLNTAGYCLPILDVISKLSAAGPHVLAGATVALLVCSPTELHTKSSAADIIFQLNRLGCQFPGHPMVEAVAGLKNFRTWQKTLPLSLEEICLEQCAQLVARLMEFQLPTYKSPRIAALHSNSHSASNTLALWNMVKAELSCRSLEEFNVENGTIMDCKGCSFKTCLHFSKQTSCFYGGIVVEEIYPAIEKADAVVWICPNYNDAVAANISAVINRLTALYRKTGFYDKALYAIIVSGNSGSDSVAMQLLNALCVNKGFYLPPHFCIMETANDPGAIYEVKGIEARAKAFANNILSNSKIF